jgi:hypothetical protein
MKNILMILFVVAIAMTSCKNDNQDLSNSFDKLQKESDSLVQTHMALKVSHMEQMSSHSTISEKLNNAPLADSIWLETLATQQVVLKNHEAQIQKHEQVLAGHQELKANFNNLTTEEMQAQIDAIDAELKEMKKEQSTLLNEYETLGHELLQIREEYKKQEMTARMKQ